VVADARDDVKRHGRKHSDGVRVRERKVGDEVVGSHPHRDLEKRRQIAQLENSFSVTRGKSVEQF
jgi:hypothetical protein